MPATSPAWMSSPSPITTTGVCARFRGSPEIWAEIRRQTERFHEPGRFVTLLGYEWTSWLHGHRHVLYFEDRGEVLSSIDPAYETPAQLWQALRGRPALTFAHHSAGGPIATDWSYPPDPELEPVTEVVSVHGSSEAADTPGRSTTRCRGTSCATCSIAATDSAWSAAATATTATRGWRTWLRRPAAWRRSWPRRRPARRCSRRCAPAASTPPTGRGSTSPPSWRDGRWAPPWRSAELGPRATLTVRVVAPGPLDGIDLVRSGGAIETVDCAGRLGLRAVARDRRSGAGRLSLSARSSARRRRRLVEPVLLRLRPRRTM